MFGWNEAKNQVSDERNPLPVTLGVFQRVGITIRTLTDKRPYDAQSSIRF